MPTRAHIHIQNMAPGPPIAMALATPAMLPLPTVLPRAVAKAPKDETLLPLSFFTVSFLRKRVPIVLRIISPKRRNWKKRRPMVR